MTLEERRWMEIQLFYFCYDLYNIRKDLLDVVYAIDAIAQIGNFKTLRMKDIAAKLLERQSNQIHPKEFIHVAHANGVPIIKIAERVNLDRSTVYRTVKEPIPAFHPLFDESIDKEIGRFLQLLEVFKKAGVQQ